MSICQKNVNISTHLCQYFKKKLLIFQQIYVNISKKNQFFDKFISIFRKNVNSSTNLCQYFNKFMSILQINVNIS